ncbi:MAG: Rieske 2Fe-2S domain-containing protein [Chloroflexi bacterium]|nr:Rieske 2Fe-2S domain-containing protein [Chloroflexota bacterium]
MTDEPDPQADVPQATPDPARALAVDTPVATPLPKRELVTRRIFILGGFWTAMALIPVGLLGSSLDFMWPRGGGGFGGPINVTPDRIPEEGADPLNIVEGRFWMVHLTQEQGGPGLLALWWKCPHLGCTVPWKDTFVWPDPTTGAPKKGWFRCPCHGSTYTDAGVLVFGPAPRSLDTMSMTIQNGRIIVDTGDTTRGGPDNAERVTRI